MGISRDSEHKHRATGGKRPQTRKKRQFLLGRPAAMTKLAPHRVHMVRTRGGNTKYRALRLDQGNPDYSLLRLYSHFWVFWIVYNGGLIISRIISYWMSKTRTIYLRSILWYVLDIVFRLYDDSDRLKTEKKN